MEAGPDRLTITRNGVIVHQGRHALARPDTAEPRITTAAGPDGAIGWAVVQEREYTPAEMSALEQKILARGAELPPATTRSSRPRRKGKAGSIRKTLKGPSEANSKGLSVCGI
ncbi:hypothetical protein [Streptomyces sp. NPDC056323]|uniref:hypothetical protein n=1 Tax=Streptomyces sp. NPDC056323 TaxID=3345784 RepID=UPI0035E1FCC9